MSYACTECGKVHDELPRFFMWRAPETPDGKVLQVQEDRKSMGRSEDGRGFVHCEVELPVNGSDDTVLGFVCWVEVPVAEYERLLHYRKNEKLQPAYAEWIEGTLANSINGVSQSHGTQVKFAVQENDPTPYIKWAAPGSTLAKRLEEGATMKFWHDVAFKVPSPGEG